MNKVALIGRLGQDPEMQYFESGKCKTKFSIAIKGTKKDESLWLNIEAWDKTAELIGEHFKKGNQIGITGRIQVDQYEQDGQKKSKTYIVVETIDFIDKKES